MERTLVIIKPDGVRRHLVGSIIRRFEAKGLTTAEMKFETMTSELTREHYQRLTERSFSDELIDCMTSDSVIYFMLVDEEMIDIIRKVVGATRVVDTAPGTIQGDCALSGTENTTRTSDPRDVAIKEIVRFFPPFDINRPSKKATK